MSGKPRKPTAFRLSDLETENPTETPTQEPPRAPVAQLQEAEATDTGAPAAIPAGKPRQKARTRWLSLFFAALGGLVTLSLGLALERLLTDLYARHDWLGHLGLGLLAVGALALVAFLIREGLGLRQVKRMDHLRKRAEAAAEADDADAARRVMRDLIAFYQHDPGTAHGRRAAEDHLGEVIDGRDLIGLGEQDLLHPFDSQARAAIMDHAKRVSVVTAISPRALIDVGFVLVSIVRLVRQISQIYGGRPGLFGFLALFRQILGHLAITGGIAMGDALVQQLVGQGIAARLSARLGEGVINGLLTARVGISAMNVCRPLPYVASDGPTIKEFLSELTKGVPGASDDKTGKER